MNLNITNIPYILKRLSCCITNFGSLLYKQSQVGNKDCFEDTRDNIIILNNIYKILNNSINTTYPTYQYNLNNLPGPTVCVCNIIDNNTGIVLAQGYNTASTTPLPTSEYAINLALDNLTTNYPCYQSTIIYHEDSITKSNFIKITIANNCECVNNLSIHLYQPLVNTPPYTGIQPNIVFSDISNTDISQTYIPGNCNNKECFTQDQLNELYQQSLNICKDCNCN